MGETIKSEMSDKSDWSFWDRVWRRV